MSLASSNSSAMVSPAAILMLTSSLSSSRGSLGRCLEKSRSCSFPDPGRIKPRCVGPYLRRMSLSWLAAQMVSSSAQDSSALVWSWLVCGGMVGQLPSALL